MDQTRVLDFKNHFKITETFDSDLHFKLDADKNSFASWHDKDYILTNRRNPNIFLSASTMKYNLKYGVDFLRAIRLVPARILKTPPKAPEKAGLSLEKQLDLFKTFHEIPNLPSNLKLVDGNLSTTWKNKEVPLFSSKKPLKKSTLQSKYGSNFLKNLNIKPIIRPIKKPTKQSTEKSGLAELPFNQIKYDKDFLNALDEFFLRNVKRPHEFKLVKLQAPMGEFLKTYEMKIPSEYKDLIVFFSKAKPLIENTLKEELEDLEGFKFSVGFKLVFIKFGIGPPVFTDPPIRFYTKQRVVLNLSDINVDPEVANIINRKEKFVQDGSGWKLNALITLWLDIGDYKPIRGSSYIPLPDALKNKKAIINVKNNDEMCLRYALRSALFPVKKNSDLLSSYPKEDGLCFEGVSFPASIDDVKKVERLNNLRINVYGWESNKVVIYHISTQSTDLKHINLMLIQQETKYHFMWIKSFSRLLGSKNKTQNFFWERCLISFSRRDLLEKHIEDCQGVND